MKNLIRISLLFIALTLSSQITVAQTQAAPPPPSDHGTSTDQTPGGGAPIGSGLFILLALGGIYGGVKVYKTRKKVTEVS